MLLLLLACAGDRDRDGERARGDVQVRGARREREALDGEAAGGVHVHRGGVRGEVQDAERSGFGHIGVGVRIGVRIGVRVGVGLLGRGVLGLLAGAGEQGERGEEEKRGAQHEGPRVGVRAS